MPILFQETPPLQAMLRHQTQIHILAHWVVPFKRELPQHNRTQVPIQGTFHLSLSRRTGVVLDEEISVPGLATPSPAIMGRPCPSRCTEKGNSGSSARVSKGYREASTTRAQK
ncbi:hypothetical protein MRX96_058294 [Rhipicephalus microplus]